MIARHVLPCVAALLFGIAGVAAAPPAGDPSQLVAVRERIRELERRLGSLSEVRQDVDRQREALTTELELAEARVEVLELELGSTRDELVRLRSEIDAIGVELELRRASVEKHFEMVVLLGRPGPLQLLWDAAVGGDLERSVTTVAALTEAQVRLATEYQRLRRDRAQQMATLSHRMERARKEADELLQRRRELQQVRADVEVKLAQLDRQQRQTGTELQEYRQREDALERLLEVVARRERLTGGSDIRRFRGALPWPAAGTVVRGFGRHYLPKYATYTVCNGLRIGVPSGTEVRAVFPGQVAFARHFRGYGNMVVVDHGNDVYTLVAGLASIHARVDQRVEMGTRLGLAAPPTDDGNLYFEVRVAGKPQNPRRWLQLDEGRS